MPKYSNFKAELQLYIRENIDDDDFDYGINGNDDGATLILRGGMANSLTNVEKEAKRLAKKYAIGLEIDKEYEQ